MYFLFDPEQRFYLAIGAPGPKFALLRFKVTGFAAASHKQSGQDKEAIGSTNHPYSVLDTDQPSLRFLNSKPLSSSLQCLVHSQDLSFRKHILAIVICKIHKIHKHIPIRAIAARDVRKPRFANIWTLLRWCIVHEIGAFAIFFVAP